MFSVKTLAGPGYIILNVLRAVNIIALLSVCAASIVMLVKTFVVSKVPIPLPARSPLVLALVLTGVCSSSSSTRSATW